ncbi:hypothetical protein EV183_001908 [Coemansia sp. RSA 2336]|nr:hypothetical protein EV183_001908 [Coemansia sp. RSA 2336]
MQQKSGGRRQTIKRTIRRSLKTDSATSDDRDTEQRRVKPHHLFRHGAETERSLVELLQPTCALQQMAREEEKHAEKRLGWHMLKRLGTMYPRQKTKRGLLWKRDEYPASDDAQTAQKGHKHDCERVYRDAVLMAQQQGTQALNRKEIRRVLEQAQADTQAALRRVDLLLKTRDGIVLPVDPTVQLRGAENAGDTCYLDSIVVALFAAHTSCDGLLFMRDLGDRDANGVQALCRLLTNFLRAGELVSADMMEQLRAQLVKCGWPGAHGQQDAGELFLFLMQTLQMPFLPLEMRMVHGADSDANDSRVVTQRAIELALPSEDNGHEVGLQQLLAKHFFDNRIEQLERELHMDVDAPVRVRTGAWAVLAMHPFYTPQSEMGSDGASAEYPDNAPLVVPLLLKRYQAGPDAVRRAGRHVAVPLQMDATEIISTHVASDSKDRAATTPVQRTQASDQAPPPYSAAMRYRLELQAAVCHKGSSTSSGHYVALVRASGLGAAPGRQMRRRRRHSWPRLDAHAPVCDGAGEFVRLDDLEVAHGRARRVGQAQALAEMGADGYVLLYRLQPANAEDCSSPCSLRRAASAKALNEFLTPAITGQPAHAVFFLRGSRSEGHRRGGIDPAPPEHQGDSGSTIFNYGLHSLSTLVPDSYIPAADTDFDFTTLTSAKNTQAVNDLLFDAFVSSDVVGSADAPAPLQRAHNSTQSLPSMAGFMQPSSVFMTPSASVPATPALGVPGSATLPPSDYTLLSSQDSLLNTPALPWASPASAQLRDAPLFAPLDELRGRDSAQLSDSMLLGQLAASDPSLHQSLVHALVDYIQPSVAYQPVPAGLSPPELLQQAQSAPELPEPTKWVNEADASFVDSLLSLLSPAAPELTSPPLAAIPEEPESAEPEAPVPGVKRKRSSDADDSPGASKRQFHCDICNRSFSRQYNMRTHRLTHDPQSQAARPHKCAHCLRRFTRKHDLERHQVLHDDSGAFKCDVCHRGFARADVLERHANAVHRKCSV